jgi:hypothetical protein
LKKTHIFSEFDPAFKDDLDTEIIEYLKKLWNTNYVELNDEDYGYKVEHESNLEDDLKQLLDYLNSEQQKVFLKRSQRFAWSMTLAVLPILKNHLDSRLKVNLFKQLSSWLTHTFDMKTLKKIISLYSHNGHSYAAYESLFVLLASLGILKKSDIEKANYQIIDSCLLGIAICPGTLSRRVIFNWIINDVFPHIYMQKRADYIYTFQTKIPHNWLYYKTE